MNLETVILAAGKGTRMFSSMPKVLHELSGKSMLGHVLDAVHELDCDHIHVVYGHGGQQVKDKFSGLSINWVQQSEQKGTGHAVAQAMPDINEDSIVLILYGDVPLIRPTTLSPLVQLAAQSNLALLTIELEEPGSLGRIIRDHQDNITAITEFKDATQAERVIKEINTGVVAVQARFLRKWLTQISDNNAQKEFYLTDIVELAVNDSVPVVSIQAETELEIMGVNSKLELAKLERMQQQQLAFDLLRQGLSISDPARFDLRGRLDFGEDCHVDVNTVIEGDCEFGNNVRIGAHCIIKNSKIADHTRIEAFSLIEDSTVGARCNVGPYARLRPGSELKQGSRIGNFVEIKNSTIGKNSKANHLSYVGDAQVGNDVNMGAGMITCNYDGANKHKTIIGDNVHVGSDCQLVAPVRIDDGATIGAGTTVYKNAPKDELTINKKEQYVLAGWKRPQKNK